MTSKRLYFVLIGTIVILFVALIGGTYQVNETLTSRAKKLTSLKAKNAALAQEQIVMKKAKQDIKTYSELQKITRSIVPEDKSQAEAVREIVKIAADNGVELASITFPASTLGGPATAVKPDTAATPPAAANSSKTGSLSQLMPVKSIPGVYQLNITVQSDTSQPVRYDKFISFLGALERNRRTAQVSTISLEPDKENRNFLSFTLNLNEYIKP